MTLLTINSAEAKEQLPELLNRVAHNKERIILTRRGKEIAAIIPIEDLALVQDSENKNDLLAATEALNEARKSEAITLDEIKNEQVSSATPYHIKIAPKAAEQIKMLNTKNYHLVIKLIEALAINPRPPGATKIAGMTGLYTEKLDSIQLIYKIEDQEILILMVK